MSEQAVREIQLTGKQIVFLFMSIVVVGVVVFLLGVAVGRGVRNAVSDAPISADAGTGTDTAVPPTTATEPPVLTYDELLRGGAPKEPAKAAEPPTPPAETAPPPAAETKPAPPVTAPAAAAPKAAAAPAEQVWFLQVGAYRTRGRADEIAAELKKISFPAFVLLPAAGTPVNLFRVRIGPFERAEAEEIRGRLVRQGYQPSITR